MNNFEAQVLADLCVLKSQMSTLLGEGQPGRLAALEDRVERHEMNWQRAKGFAAAMGVLLTLLNVALDGLIRR